MINKYENVSQRLICRDSGAVVGDDDGGGENGVNRNINTANYWKRITNNNNINKFPVIST